jgi:hypothetical protein
MAMNLRVDVRSMLATAAPGRAQTGTADCGLASASDQVDLRHLPWEDGFFAALELDDVPAPDAWTISGPALNECRRVLKRNGLLEIRTRRVEAKQAQATEKAAMGSLMRLLQNHGFEVVSVDAIDDQGSMISALALRTDGPEDLFSDAIGASAAHVTLHSPLLDGGDDAAANRALAVSLDAQGVKVRVRVIFDVLDALYSD